MQLTKDQFRSLGIAFDDVTIMTPVYVEPPIVMGGIVCNAQIGQYSFANGALVGNKDARIVVGRYCQFALGSQVGVGGHPTNWLSSHVFQYRDHFHRFPADDPYGLRDRFKEATPTAIGDDVWVGANAVVLAGVTVGPGAIIGAGAVVVDDVPPYAIVGGVPAKIIRMRFPEPIIERLLAVRWWQIQNSLITRLPFNNIEACLLLLEEMAATGKDTRNEPRFFPVG